MKEEELEEEEEEKKLKEEEEEELEEEDHEEEEEEEEEYDVDLDFSEIPHDSTYEPALTTSSAPTSAASVAELSVVIVDFLPSE